MKILKTLGAIGAIGASAIGLILAGKSELGKGLFTGNDPDDAGDPTETPINTAAEETTEIPEMEAVEIEPADSSDTE